MLVPFVTLAIETGARYGVIRTLPWRNVDFKNRCLKWGKDKTPAGTGRVVPLSQRALPAEILGGTIHGAQTGALCISG